MRADITLVINGVLIALFLIGFTIYAIIYAAVGAMHNNEQEAQQYNFVVIAPIIFPALVASICW